MEKVRDILISFNFIPVSHRYQRTRNIVKLVLGGNANGDYVSDASLLLSRFQALQFELVQYLLGLLNGTLKVENQAATKAQIVKALKAMLRDLTHGMEVKRRLLENVSKDDNDRFENVI